MITIRTHRRVGRTMNGTTGVIVNHRLVAEIDDVQRTIGTDAIFNRPEPQVLAADELSLLPAGLALRFVGHSIRLDHEVADDVQRGLGGEVAVVPLRRPGTAFINRTTRSSCVAANLVDLHIRLLLPVHCRIRRLFRQHPIRAHDTRKLAFRQHILRQHDMDEVIAARGLRIENLTIARNVKPPGVATT